MSTPPLTKKRAKWSKNRSVVLKGSRLAYNVAQQQRYLVALEKLVKQMTFETQKQLKKFFKGELADDFFIQQEKASALDASLGSQARILMNALTRKFTSLFSKQAMTLAQNMVIATNKTSKNQLHSSLEKLTGGLSLKTGVVPEGMEDITTATIAENVSLIKSIPQQYFKDVTGSVMRSITTGTGIHELIPEIEKYEGQTYRRAKNLALDQTRKAYNAINKQRLQALGIKKFEWLHSSGGQHPRESHIKISGKIFSFENLEAEQAALGVPEADRGLPGFPINCKCVMGPVIDFSNEIE
jgi:SPP1 gp7 family putative phage head morphogenesis protein